MSRPCAARLSPIAALCLALVPRAAAQDPPAPAVPAAAAPRVVNVEPASGGLGDRITVTVQGLAAALQQSGGCAKLVLFLGGMPVTGLPPERCDPDDGRVAFLLDRDDASGRTWRSLLGRPTSFTHPVALTVGSSADLSFATDVTQFDLVILPRREFWVFVVGSILMLVFFLRLGRDGELLRAPQAEPVPGQRRPYSLSRCQMAFWSVLTVLAYVFVWLVTGELDTITESMLVLMGISSGTALTAGLMESNKAATAAAQAQRLAAECNVIAAAMPALESRAAAGSGGTDAVHAATEMAANKMRLAQVTAQLKLHTAPVKPGSLGLFTDILSDSAGISIQRFQMLIWTVVLGLIFCGSVYATLEMPEFSSTLLALMGVSSGTYLGFKVPERFATRPTENAAGT